MLSLIISTINYSKYSTFKPKDLILFITFTTILKTCLHRVWILLTSKHSVLKFTDIVVVQIERSVGKKQGQQKKIIIWCSRRYRHLWNDFSNIIGCIRKTRIKCRYMVLIVKSQQRIKTSVQIKYIEIVKNYYCNFLALFNLQKESLFYKNTADDFLSYLLFHVSTNSDIEYTVVLFVKHSCSCF